MEDNLVVKGRGWPMKIIGETVNRDFGAKLSIIRLVSWQDIITIFSLCSQTHIVRKDCGGCC